MPLSQRKQRKAMAHVLVPVYDVPPLLTCTEELAVPFDYEDSDSEGTPPSAGGGGATASTTASTSPSSSTTARSSSPGTFMPDLFKSISLFTGDVIGADDEGGTGTSSTGSSTAGAYVGRPSTASATNTPGSSRIGTPFRGRVFETRLRELKEFKAKHGSCNVPLNWPEKPILGIWVSMCRRERSQLTKEQVKALDDFDFDWNDGAATPSHLADGGSSWNGMYAELFQFKAKNGTPYVPLGWPENPGLAAWTAEQYREYYYYFQGLPSSMTPECALRLRSLGFGNPSYPPPPTYLPSPNPSPTRKSSPLPNHRLIADASSGKKRLRMESEGKMKPSKRQYKKQSPHWEDRKTKALSKVSPDGSKADASIRGGPRALVSATPVSFSSSTATVTPSPAVSYSWEELRKYKNSQGSFVCPAPSCTRVFKSISGFKYHLENTCQQEDDSTSYVASLLPASEAPRDPTPQDLHNEMLWNDSFKALCEYKRKHGNTSGGSGDDTLCRWCKRQRYGCRAFFNGERTVFTMERMMKLDSIGFDWKGYDSKRPANLAKMVTKRSPPPPTVEYEEETPRPKRRIGADPGAVGKEVFTPTWDQLFDDLVDFKKEHGTFEVPPDRKDLHQFIAAQREAYKKRRKTPLQEEQEGKLDRIGFVWDAPPNDSSKTDDAEKSSSSRSRAMSEDHPEIWICQSCKNENSWKKKRCAECLAWKGGNRSYAMKGDSKSNNGSATGSTVVDGQMPQWTCVDCSNIQQSWSEKRCLKCGGVARRTPDPIFGRSTVANISGIEERNHNDKQWNGAFQKLCRYKEENGTLEGVDHGRDNEKERKWMVRQRRAFAEALCDEDSTNSGNTFTYERKLKLDALGFDWKFGETLGVEVNGNESNYHFNHHFGVLCDYKSKHGSTNGDNNTVLRRWIDRQRRECKAWSKGEEVSFNQDRKDCLDRIGFDWRGSDKSPPSSSKPATSKEYEVEVACASSGDYITSRRKKRTNSYTLSNIASSIINYPVPDKVTDSWKKSLIDLCKFQMTHGDVPETGKGRKWLEAQAKEYARKGKYQKCGLSIEHCRMLEEFANFTYGGAALRSKIEQSAETESEGESDDEEEFEVEVACASSGDYITSRREKTADSYTLSNIASSIMNHPVPDKVTDSWKKSLIDLCKFQMTHGDVPETGKGRKWLEAQVKEYVKKGKYQKCALSIAHCAMLEEFANFVYGGAALRSEIDGSSDTETSEESSSSSDSEEESLSEEDDNGEFTPILEVAIASSGDFVIKPKDKASNTYTMSNIASGIMSYPVSYKVTDSWKKSLVELCKFQIKHGDVPDQGKGGAWAKDHIYQFCKKSQRKSGLAISAEHYALLEKFAGFRYHGAALQHEINDANADVEGEAEQPSAESDAESSESSDEEGGRTEGKEPFFHVEISVSTSGEYTTSCRKKWGSRNSIQNYGTTIQNYDTGAAPNQWSSRMPSDSWKKSLIECCKYQMKHGDIPSSGKIHRWVEEMVPQYLLKKKRQTGTELSTQHVLFLEKFAGFRYYGKSLTKK